MTVDREARTKLMDSLTLEQRQGIAQIIRSADSEGYYGEDYAGNSVWHESVSATLNNLSREFECYDPESAIN